MKTKNLLSAILVVSGLAIACLSVAQNIDSVNNVMEGKWIWTACYGGFSGECYDNPGPGNQRSVIFTKTDTDSVLFEVYKNDTLKVSGITKFEYLVTEFINVWTIEKDIVHGETLVDPHDFFIIRRTDSTKVTFEEPCIDCYYYEYQKEGTVVGSEDPRTINNIFIYPNPAGGRLYVRNDNLITELEIIDITGKVVCRKKNETGNRLIAVDISYLKSGAYFLKFLSGNRIYLNRFLKL
jgi:hypothetical protein